MPHMSWKLNQHMCISHEEKKSYCINKLSEKEKTVRNRGRWDIIFKAKDCSVGDIWSTGNLKLTCNVLIYFRTFILKSYPGSCVFLFSSYFETNWSVITLCYSQIKWTAGQFCSFLEEVVCSIVVKSNIMHVGLVLSRLV